VASLIRSGDDRKHRGRQLRVFVPLADQALFDRTVVNKGKPRSLNQVSTRHTIKNSLGHSYGHRLADPVRGTALQQSFVLVCQSGLAPGGLILFVKRVDRLEHARQPTMASPRE
jgi:hypothetical protein